LRKCVVTVAVVVVVAMSVEVVKMTDIKRARGRQKYSKMYEAWFSQALGLKKGEALKIVLTKKPGESLPSAPAIRFAVDRWNKDNPDKRLGKTWRNIHTDEPVLYLFPEKEEERPRKQSGKASS
jgi:hypothetical protein